MKDLLIHLRNLGKLKNQKENRFTVFKIFYYYINMKKLKIALHFIKIRLKNIGSILIKTSAGYAVASFGLIQVASVVTDNLSTESIFGISSESFMQILFIGVLVLFPIVLIISYITRKKTIDRETLKNFDENNSTIDDYRPIVINCRIVLIEIF